MVEFKHTDYTTAKGVLVFPDHYVSVAHTFKKDDAAAVTQDGRKIVKAGTLYPSNDVSAIGIVWADYDVTDGDRTGALIIHGFVKTKALPVIPSSAAKGALKMIQFLPLEAVTLTMTAQGINIATGEAAGTLHQVRVDIVGVHFRDAAATLSNWTITGEDTAKVKVESIELGPDGTYALFNLKNSAAAAAGSVTVAPKAAATSTGDVATAVTIVTVA